MLLITSLLDAQTHFACYKENKQARIKFRSCNVLSIPLQKKNYNVTSTNFPVIFSSGDEEVHVHYVHTGVQNFTLFINLLKHVHIYVFICTYADK